MVRPQNYLPSLRGAAGDAAIRSARAVNDRPYIRSLDGFS